MSTYDQIQNPVLRKACLDADQAYMDVVKKMDWSSANVKKGYLNGLSFRLIDAADSAPDDIEEHAEYIEKRLETAIIASDYGRAAFWKAYSIGWGVACVMVSSIEEVVGGGE